MRPHEALRGGFGTSCLSCQQPFLFQHQNEEMQLQILSLPRILVFPKLKTLP